MKYLQGFFFGVLVEQKEQFKFNKTPKCEQQSGASCWKCSKNECEDSSRGFWKLWWPYLTFFWHFADWMINRWTDDINVGLIGDKRDWLSEAAVALRFPVGWKVLPSLKRKKAWSVWMQVMCSASVLSAMHISSLALSKSYGGWVNK